jgi:hypothetical protein
MRALTALAAIGLAEAFQIACAPGLAGMRMSAEKPASSHETRRLVLKGGLGAALLAAPALAHAINIGPVRINTPSGAPIETEINGQLLDKSAECKVSLSEIVPSLVRPSSSCCVRASLRGLSLSRSLSLARSLLARMCSRAHAS